MKSENITLTPELYNLLTADLADGDAGEEFTKEDLMQMIKAARESIK